MPDCQKIGNDFTLRSLRNQADKERFAAFNGIYNTEAEVDFVVEKVPPIIETLRELSPFWKPEQGICATGA